MGEVCFEFVILQDYLGDLARVSPIRQEQIGGQAADAGLYFSGQREEKQRLQLEKEQYAEGFERNNEKLFARGAAENVCF